MFETISLMIYSIFLQFCLVLMLATGSWAALATEKSEFNLVIRNHKFEPAQLTIPAQQKVLIIIDNQDNTSEEFESHELNREKVIPGLNKAKIFIGPLQAGTYSFFGDFHQDSAQGTLLVK